MKTTLPIIISEQSLLKFTGRVNILMASDNRYIGAIFIRSGVIVHAKYLDHFSHRALENIITEDYRTHANPCFKYIVEPELIVDDEDSLSIDSESFNKLVSTLYRQYDDLIKLRPPASLTIKINPAFISQGDNIDNNEFDLLKTLTDQQSVSEIVENSNLTEYELLQGLISLRQKKAITVVSE